MGSRSAGGEKATQWVRQAGGQSSEGTFADAAAHGEIVFNCTSGAGSLDALRAAGSKNLSDKILVDVANPLDFSHGMPPTLFVCNTDSLGEQIQRAYPQAKVVKTLNTVTSAVMVNPSLIAAEQTMFISGNDTAAKETVIGLLKRDFGWEKVFDLGDITGARAQEMHLALWLRLFVTLQTPNVNIDVAR
jgi:predicted dinucleotide-binding enzyme